MDTELYKCRSFSSCIKAAYFLFSTNIMAIFKKTWLPAILYSLILSTSVMMYMPDKALNSAGMNKPMVTLSIMLSIYILDLAIGTWFLASIISMLNGKNFKLNLTRSIILTGISIVLSFVIGFVLYSFKEFTAIFLSSVKASATTTIVAPIGVMVILTIIFGIILLPFSFSSMKYIVDHTFKLKDMFNRDYFIGWHYWGFLFITLFITLIIASLVSLIMLIPLFIITIAQGVNQLGIIDGDQSGVPGYFPYLLFMTSVVTMFIFVYLSMWADFVLYYAYGSIEAIEKEKKEAIGTINKEDKPNTIK